MCGRQIKYNNVSNIPDVRYKFYANQNPIKMTSPRQYTVHFFACMLDLALINWTFYTIFHPRIIKKKPIKNKNYQLLNNYSPQNDILIRVDD